MRKFLLGLLVVVVIAVAYLLYDEFTYSPLKKTHFQKLFNNYSGNAKKSCSVDFIGISFRGEIFDIYSYKTGNASINQNFPDIKEWENKEISDETIMTEWKSCPLNTQTMELFRFELQVNDLDNEKCSSFFKRELDNSKNYYSYIYFSPTEHYFLLYCPEKEELYYLRSRGF